FGTKDVLYSKDDDTHFTISAKVYISDQFYGWLCGLGKRVKIISPEYVANDYKAFLDKIRKMYDSD
ncbi:MAG: WYL domain-containing protein, partial [Oscillospiraceae bacterium]|nr:WYL domain-containing protein [Oscillospiraceae bacterium]